MPHFDLFYWWRFLMLFQRDDAFNITMSKSKNHTNHNQNKKAHKNGIKKPKTYRYRSLKSVDAKFRRNHRYALQGTAKAIAEGRAGN
ncbi:hypothetical protein OY671_006491 [Metschnikowia pulcherrima]|nr:hypothetical protein OY671_006491 [Metschnikowia pulcherrima]